MLWYQITCSQISLPGPASSQAVSIFETPFFSRRVGWKRLTWSTRWVQNPVLCVSEVASNKDPIQKWCIRLWWRQNSYITDVFGYLALKLPKRRVVHLYARKFMKDYIAREKLHLPCHDGSRWPTKQQPDSELPRWASRGRYFVLWSPPSLSKVWAYWGLAKSFRSWEVQVNLFWLYASHFAFCVDCLGSPRAYSSSFRASLSFASPLSYVFASSRALRYLDFGFWCHYPIVLPADTLVSTDVPYPRTLLLLSLISKARRLFLSVIWVSVMVSRKQEHGREW